MGPPGWLPRGASGRRPAEGPDTQLGCALAVSVGGTAPCTPHWHQKNDLSTPIDRKHSLPEHLCAQN